MPRHRLSNWILCTLLLVFVGWSLPSGLSGVEIAHDVLELEDAGHAANSPDAK